MKALRVDEVSLDRHAGGGVFPFKLRRKTRAVPIRVGVRFEIAHVSDGLGFVHGSKTGKREIPPGAVALHPVKRRLPALFVHRGPAERKPEFRTGISAGFHEGEIFAVCDQAIRERKCGHERAVARAFVVVGKSGAVVADHNGRFIELDETLRRDLAGFRLPLRWAERLDRAGSERRHA